MWIRNEQSRRRGVMAGPVENPNVAPYSAVALLRIETEDGGGGWASGSLIGPRHILTAAHNLYKPGVRRARRITAFPAYSSDARPDQGGSEAGNGFYPSAYPHGHDVDRSWDIGVLALKTPINLN